MTTTDIDNVPALMGLFWLGFSLAFICLIWLQRVSAAGKLGKLLTESFGPATLPLRITLTVLGLIGVFGSAGLSSVFSHIPWANAAFLLGLAVGIVMALMTWKIGPR